MYSATKIQAVTKITKAVEITPILLENTKWDHYWHSKTAET